MASATQADVQALAARFTNVLERIPTSPASPAPADIDLSPLADVAAQFEARFPAPPADPEPDPTPAPDAAASLVQPGV